MYVESDGHLKKKPYIINDMQSCLSHINELIRYEQGLTS